MIGGNNCKLTFSIRLDTNEYTVKNDLVKPRWFPGVCCLRNVIYAIGGESGNKYRRSVECFDLRKNEWLLMKEKLPEKL